MLVPDALIFEAGHIERSAAEYAAGHLAGDAAHAAKSTTSLVARKCLIDPSLAIVTSETRTTTTGGGDPRIGTETMVLRKQSDKWRIAHIHWSSRKLPPGSALPSAAEASRSCS